MIAEIGDSARDWNETKKTVIKTGNVIPNTYKKNKIWKLTSKDCTLFYKYEINFQLVKL